MSSRYSEARDGSQGASNTRLGPELLKEQATGCNTEKGRENRLPDSPIVRALIWRARLQRGALHHREVRSGLDHPQRRGAHAGFEKDAPLVRD